MEQQFPELDRRAVAFHEAGHAVVAKCLGLSVLTVSIVENKDSRGRVAHDWFEAIDYQDDDDDAIHRQMEKKIMAALAGPAAEAIAAPETYHRDRHSGFGGGDFDVAEGLLERIHGLRVKIAAAHLQYLELAAKAWVEQHWKAIESVSTALLEKGTLDEKQLCEAMWASRGVGAYPFNDLSTLPDIKCSIKILWGDNDHPEDGPKIYNFDTEAEARAFLKGADEAVGWSSYELLSENYVVAS